MNKNIQLPKSETCRDLGVVIASDLLPSHHIREIVSKAHQRANHILRCFISGDNKLLVKAFVVYVCPIREYNSMIWSPCLKKTLNYSKKCSDGLLKDYKV